MSPKISPYTIPNIRLFIAFRIFFNARFYYPVFTILFLDYGLSLEQFSLLNTVWAITIVCADVPSGAVADILGRKALMIATSLLMVAEMSLLAFVPLGNSTLIFSVFLVNRILSGLAEALASGADEAIAYDSLLEKGDAEDWPKVLSLQFRLRSIASVLTMTVGALVYDPNMVNRFLGWFGLTTHWDQQVTMRFPVYLTLMLALAATAISFGMQEKPREKGEGGRVTVKAALQKSITAGAWLLRSPFALAVILFCTLFDHILRMIVTLTSQYFRLINLPEASFGLIGSVLSVLGVVTPKIAEWMAAKNSPLQNVIWLSVISLTGLLGLTGFFPYWGLLPMALIYVALMLISFFSSHYLNRVTESHQRATVLSFKGLAFNLAYASIGCGFAVLISQIREAEKTGHLDWTTAMVESAAFKSAIAWFPWYMIIGLLLTGLFCLFRFKGSKDREKIRQPG